METSNFDTALFQLASEINALEADRKSTNQSKQIEMGYKLIAAKNMIEETDMNWYTWVEKNIALSKSQVYNCIRAANDPSFLEKKVNQYRISRTKPRGFISRAIKAWPTWTFEEREQFSIGILKLLETA